VSEQMHVVIVGGGFGGLYAAKTLGGSRSIRVTLIDKRNFHQFTPMLYQVAIAALSPAEIASPLRGILRRYRNVQVLKGEVVAIDPGRRVVELRDGSVAYDALIVATGMQPAYFGNEAWRQHAPPLQTLDDAIAIRRRVLLAFEAAERESDPERRRALLTFVVVGGGPTGVELAGALAELAHATLRGEFRQLNLTETRIVLVDAGERILPTYHPDQAPRAARYLKPAVTLRTNSQVVAVTAEHVTIRHAGQEEVIPTHTVLWAAGVHGSPLGAHLAQRTGATLDRSGRVHVAPDLSVPGHPGIFVIGDLAHVSSSPGGPPLIGVAQVAMQQGAYVGRLLKARVRGASYPPFLYYELPRMAVIGRGAAIFEHGRLRFGGFFAWVLWLAIHVFYLIGFGNRLLVMVQWALAYITFRQRVRIITGEDPAAPLVARQPDAELTSAP
jgi:NADH:ubiquinone reductase (H+-translocating)